MAKRKIEHLTESSEQKGLKNASATTLEVLQDAQARMGSSSFAIKAWNELLTPAQQRKLKGDLQTAWSEMGTVRMLATAWHCSSLEAIVRVLEEYQTLSPPELRHLRTELGIAAPTAPSDEKPIWNRATGVLSFKTRPIRRIRVGQAKRIASLFDAFQSAGWPDALPSPFLGRDSREVSTILYSANKGLSAIKFEMDGSGTGVRWRLI